MYTQAENKLERIIVVGDRILIKPVTQNDRTGSGLYLPQGIREKEVVQTGYVMKTGPGYPVPLPSEDENWKKQEDKIKYIPLQVKEGDLVIYLQRDSVEINYQNEKYFIISQYSILLIERDDGLFD